MPSKLISDIYQINFCINCGEMGHHYRNCKDEISECGCCGRLNHRKEYCWAKDINDECNRLGKIVKEVCINCDYTNHQASVCRLAKVECKKCLQLGHIEKYCSVTQYTRLNKCAREKCNGTDAPDSKPAVAPITVASSKGWDALRRTLTEKNGLLSKCTTSVLERDKCSTCGRLHSIKDCLVRHFLRRKITLRPSHIHCINCNRGGHLFEVCRCPPVLCTHCNERGHHKFFCTVMQNMVKSNWPKVQSFIDKNIKL